MSTSGDGAGVDLDRVRAYQFQVWSFKQGEMVSLMIHLGDRLGLYRALADAGPVTAAELARMTGLHERWLLEWLRGQAAARLLEYSDGRFMLSREGALVLADESDSLFFAAGAFSTPVEPDHVDRLADAFRTGFGVSYEDQGPRGAHRTERMLGPWLRLALVPTVLPALDGVVAKLEAGGIVADVGCGSGLAVLAMAEAFPASRFHGYDPSGHAIARAEAHRRERGAANAAFHRSRGEDLPAEGFDFVLTLDCLHDMTHPAAVAAAIRKGIADDGTWLIQDIRALDSFEDNMEKNPMLAMMYGFSVTSCMSSALSEPGGAGLGTLGLTRRLAQELTEAAGFTRFAMHDFDNPANVFYEVRP